MTETWTCGRNPVLPPDLQIPDPEAHVMAGGRTYVYGSWDQESTTYCSTRYRVVSSADLETWTVHGVAFDGEQVPSHDDLMNPTYPGGFDPTHPTPFLKAMLEADGGAGEFVPPPYGFLYAPDAA